MYHDSQGREIEDAEGDNMRRDRQEQDYPNKGPFFGNSFAGLGNGPAGDYEDDAHQEQERDGTPQDELDAERQAELHEIPGAWVLVADLERRQADYWHTHDMHKYDYLDNEPAEATEEPTAPAPSVYRLQPVPFLYCVHGCYTVKPRTYGGYSPCVWNGQAGDFEAWHHVPTYQAALAWIVEQP